MYAYDRTVINAGAEGQDPRRLIKLRVEARDKTRAAGKVRPMRNRQRGASAVSISPRPLKEGWQPADRAAR